MQQPISAVYAKDDMIFLACTLRSQQRDFTVFQGPTKHGLGLCCPPPSWTFILDSGCDLRASFLSIQQLCLPSEILLSAIDIPLQKRNSDNGNLTHFELKISGESEAELLNKPTS